MSDDLSDFQRQFADYARNAAHSPVLQRITVRCTDNGQHAPARLHKLEVTAEGIRHSSGRPVTGDWARGTVTDDGASVSDHVVVPVDSPREDYEGRERWRFKCRRCGRDQIVTGAQLRALVDVGVSSLDISLIQ